MATEVRLKHKDTGIIKNGYFGFSWTTFFFGFFPALFRSDFITFIGGFIILVILALATFGVGALIAQLIWAFMYNKYYTLKLLEKGYVFSDSPEVNRQAANLLGVSLNNN